MNFPARILTLLAALFLLWPCARLVATHPATHSGSPVLLTEQERQWLNEHHELRLGINAATPPFQFVNMEGGIPVFKGMASDYVALLEQRLGVHMVVVSYANQPDAVAMARAREIDVLPCATITEEAQDFLIFTRPYLSYPIVLITREDSPIITGLHDLQGRRIALTEDIASSNWFLRERTHTDLRAKIVPTTEAALLAVASGQVEACAANLAVASFLIHKNGLSNLHVAAPTAWRRHELALAVRSDWPILAGIMQKALDSISQDERDDISLRWISLAYDTGEGYRLALRWTFGILCGAALIITLVLLWNRRLKREVAERMRTEEALRASRKSFQDLFDSLQSGFALHEIICDDDGVPRNYRFLKVNPAFERLTGLRAAHVIGKTVLETLPGMEQSWIDRFGRVALTGEPDSFEQYSAPLDRFYEVVAYSPLRGQFAVVFTDVTERRRAMLVMMQSEKMLSLGGLAAGMAHEINNPLAGILQSAQNIQRRLLPDMEANRLAADECGISLDALNRYLQARGIQRMMETIVDAGSRAAKIVASMLSFSRQETTCLAACPLDEIIEETLTLAQNDYDLSAKYNYRNIRIVRDLEPGLPSLPCARVQIEQVLLNLIRNAAHALSTMSPPPEDPTIRIAARQEQGNVFIEVEDNGPGLSAEDQKRIFEPFFTTKAPGEGTGLGLSVSYFIITRNHDGSFDVRSTPGKGTRFIIRLPL